MDSARVFMSGRSQAVRLPKDYRFDTDQVFIKQIGHSLLLTPKNDAWELLELGLNQFEPDFYLMRNQPELQQRDDLSA